MENYLNGIKTAILLCKADSQCEREKVYSSAREAAHQFLKANATFDEAFFEELLLLEVSIDEVEQSISFRDPVRWEMEQGHQLAA